jgi:hypothetical protein
MESEFNGLLGQLPPEIKLRNETFDNFMEELIKDLGVSKEERKRRREERKVRFLLYQQMISLPNEAIVLKAEREQTLVCLNVGDYQTAIVWALLGNTTNALARGSDNILPQSGYIHARELISDTAEDRLRIDIPVGPAIGIVKSLYEYFRQKTKYEKDCDHDWGRFNTRTFLADYHGWWEDQGNHVIENTVAIFEKSCEESRKTALQITFKQEHFGHKLLELEENISNLGGLGG